MRITVITQYFPPDTGGASTRAWNVVRSLRLMGHDVVVVTAVPHYPRGIIPDEYQGKLLRAESTEGVRVVRVWVPPLPHEGIVKRFIMYMTFSISALLALPFCRGNKVTWAMSPNYLCMIPATAYKLATRSRVIQDVVDIWPSALGATGYSFPSSILRAAGLVSRVSYVLSDVVTTISDSMRLSLQKVVPQPVQVEVVGNCVTPDFFQVPSRKNGATFRVTYLGTLGPSNDFVTVLEAARRLQYDKHVCFTIAGSGELVSKIHASLEENQLENVELHGQSIKHSDVPVWLEDADALVLPLRRGFGDTSFPSKLGEYLATGRPVICMADGTLARVIKDGYMALLVSPGDVGGLVTAIMQLRQDRTLYSSLGSAGMEYARKHFSREVFDERVDNVLQLTGRGS